MNNEVSEYLEIYEHYKIKYSKYCFKQSFCLEVRKRYEESDKESLLKEASRLLVSVSNLSTHSNNYFDFTGQLIESYKELLCFIFNRCYGKLVNLTSRGFDYLPIYFTIEEVDKLFEPIVNYETKNYNKDTPTEMRR